MFSILKTITVHIAVGIALIAMIAGALQEAKGQFNLLWASTRNGQGDFDDRYTCAVSDGAGNVYVGGSVMNPDENTDYLISKFNSAGSVLWSRQFRGTSGGPDEVTAIALNQTGDVYVTGYMKQSTTGTDFCTIKLNGNGDSLWAAFYNNSTAFGYDQANAIFIGTNGQVYVTGQSDGDPTSVVNDDFATICYDQNGNQLWAQRYNGTANDVDRAIGIAADANGNVYITGRSFNGNDDDYITIKYNTSGNQVWLKTVDNGGRDRPSDMVLSVSGIYITGRSDNGNNDDFFTIKYDYNGNVSWQNNYNYVDNDRAIAMCIDASENLYITGQSDNNPGNQTDWDYLTVKYNNTGNVQWNKRYNSTLNQFDIPADIALGNDNVVYVTGASDVDGTAGISNNIVTIGYTISNGNQSMLANYNSASNGDDLGLAVAAIPGGAVAAGATENGSDMNDAFLIQYNTSGTSNWNHAQKGLGDNNENIRKIAISGNSIYAAGYIVERSMDRNFALMKWNTAGNFICQQTVNGSVSGSRDDAGALGITNGGNPFLAGFEDNSTSSNDLLWSQMDANTCDTLWTRTWLTNALGSDKIYDMIKDANGDFYITGRVDSDPSFNVNDDVFTAKINANGNVVWTQTFTNTAQSEERGSFIRLDSNGNIVVVGRTFNGVNEDLLVLTYSPLGSLVWQQIHDHGGDDIPCGFEIANDHSVYVAGRSSDPSLLVSDYFTLKYNSSGNLQWNQYYNGPGSGNDEAQCIALITSPAVRIVVSGKSDSDPTSNENMDMITVMYDESGNQQWTNVHDGSGSDDIPDAIKYDQATGRLIITGHQNNSTPLTPNYDIYTAAIGDNGNTVASIVYNSPSDSSDIPNTMIIAGNVIYIAGSSVVGFEQRDALLLAYDYNVTVTELSNNENQWQCFPNPAQDQFTLTSSGKVNSTAQFLLFDQTGRKVLAAKPSGVRNFMIDTSELPSGIYSGVVVDYDIIHCRKTIVVAH